MPDKNKGKNIIWEEKEVKEITVITKISFDDSDLGNVTAKREAMAAGIQNEDAEAAGYTICSDDDKEERYALASDLADVCEYLEDKEVIKVRLIAEKARHRKEQVERG